MKKNLDQYIKEKLEEGGIPFEDKHWDDMEALISKDRDKRGFVFFKFLWPVVFFAGLGLFLYVFSTSNYKSEPSKINKTENNAKTHQRHLSQAAPIVSLKSTQIDDKKEERASGNGISNKQIVLPGLLNNDLGSSDGFTNKKSKALNPGIHESMNATQNTNRTQADLGNAKIIVLDKTPMPSNLTARLVAPGKTLRSKPLYEMDNQTSALLPFHFRKIGLDSLKENWSLWAMIYGEYATKHSYEIPKEMELLKRDELPQSVKKIGVLMQVKKNRTSVSFGLGYTQFNARTNYKTIESMYTFDTGYVLVNRNYTSSPSNPNIALIKKVIDTTRQDFVVNNCNNCLQSLGYLQIPIGFEYAIRKGHVAFNLSSQLSSMILVSKKGQFADYDNKEAIVRSPTSPMFPSIYFDASLGLGTSYFFANDYFVGARMNYNRSLNSMFTHFNQRPSYWSVQLRTGLILGRR